MDDAHHVVVLQEFPLPGENSGLPFQLALLLKEEFLIHAPDPDKVDRELDSKINLEGEQREHGVICKYVKQQILVLTLLLVDQVIIIITVLAKTTYLLWLSPPVWLQLNVGGHKSKQKHHQVNVNDAGHSSFKFENPHATALFTVVAGIM